jgi:hypothetical protein
MPRWRRPMSRVASETPVVESNCKHLVKTHFKTQQQRQHNKNKNKPVEECHQRRRVPETCRWCAPRWASRARDHRLESTPSYDDHHHQQQQYINHFESLIVFITIFTIPESCCDLTRRQHTPTIYKTNQIFNQKHKSKPYP